MRRQGWLWTRGYIWHKKNCYPGKWPNRFRDAWERCLHFTKQRKFKMFQKEVMVPTGNWAIARLRKLSKTDKRRDESKVLSGFGKNVSNWIGRDLAYPTNVLHLATECSNRSHSAAFPKSLPGWFIKLFTEPNDLVFDPFLGSGTTALACLGPQAPLPGHRTPAEILRDGPRSSCRPQIRKIHSRQARPRCLIFANRSSSTMTRSGPWGPSTWRRRDSSWW